MRQIGTILILLISYNIYAQKVHIFEYRIVTAIGDTTKKTVSTYRMYFNQNESMVKTVELKKDTTIRYSVFKAGQPIIYKNLANNQLLIDDQAFTQKVIVRDVLDNITWVIGKENKKIGSFNCQKAETDFRGRHFIAWFTQDIPISNGPWKFQGLPGLILAANDEKREVVFEFESLFLEKEEMKIEPIVAANNQKTVSYNEYVSLFRKNLDNFTKMVSSSPELTKEGVKGSVKVDAKTIEIFPDN
jgi:GLPGLI family protein